MPPPLLCACVCVCVMRSRTMLVVSAANRLDACRMVRFHRASGNLAVTSLGRVSSHFYLQHESVETFNDMLKPDLTDAECLNVICHAQEFENIRVRDEELDELDQLKIHCPVDIRDAVENKHGKINVLLQCYISKARPAWFAVVVVAVVAVVSCWHV